MTRMDLPASLCPDPETLRSLIVEGPSHAAIARLLPDQIPMPGQVVRVHFPATRPMQLVLQVKRNSGPARTLIAEWVGATAWELAEAESARLSKPRRGQVASGKRAAVTADPAKGLIVRQPGFDTRLPGLRLLHDPEWAAETLGALGLDPESSVTLVAHRLGKRAVLRIVGRKGTQYARLRPVTSGAGHAAYDCHVELWRMLETSAELSIPRPLGFDPDVGLALFAALPGAPPVFRGLHGFRATRDIMRAILTLQSLHANVDQHHATDEIAVLTAWAARTSEVFPGLAGRLRDPLLSLTEAMLTARSLPPVLCHRDLHEGQILLHEGNVGLLDFDTMRLGDPALDAGNLQAHLMLSSLRYGSSVRAFLNAMDFAAPHLALKRLRLWRSAALLRLAMIYAFGSMPGAIIQSLIDEAADA